MILLQVWPYLLGQYKWTFNDQDKRDHDKKLRSQYENKLSDWMAIEAIVRQRDKETQAASIAKISGTDSIDKQASFAASQHISNEVFESIDEEATCVSSRTVSVDKISTITEVNGFHQCQ